MAAVLPKLRAQAIANDGDRNVAVIGGGPAGLATAFFLTRAGVPVTIFEARDSLGGVVRHVIPEFRHRERRYLPRCRALPVLWRQGAAQRSR